MNENAVHLSAALRPLGPIVLAVRRHVLIREVDTSILLQQNTAVAKLMN